MNRVLLSLILFTSVTSCYAANLYVQQDATGSSCTQSSPCGSIQDAVNAANIDDNIFVAKGLYSENVTIPAGKNGISIIGSGAVGTIVQSAGGTPSKEAPAGVAVDIIMDVFSPRVTIAGVTLLHPATVATKRDLGVFVRPPAIDVTLRNLRIERQRTGSNLEPTMPGSRGVLVLRATGCVIKQNRFQGNYEDHIHLPTSQAVVAFNRVSGATRLGIVVIQENADSLSNENKILLNSVVANQHDGIQIQGDNNMVVHNIIANNQGAGIKLCGPASSPTCVAPGATATASQNLILKNRLSNNSGGNIVDDGSDNTINSTTPLNCKQNAPNI